jgi:hypothetical protein
MVLSVDLPPPSSRSFRPVPVLPRTFREPHFLAFFPRREALRSLRPGVWWRLGRLLSGLLLLLVAVLVGLRPVA